MRPKAKVVLIAKQIGFINRAVSKATGQDGVGTQSIQWCSLFVVITRQQTSETETISKLAIVF